METFLRWFDPNDDPEAEPITVAAALAVTVVAGFSAFMFLRWKYQPVLDLGHHMAIAAVVADRGRPGSLYTALYMPFDPLLGNSLLYLFGGLVGRIIGVTTAVKIFVALYFVGVPAGLFYGLRVFGRSPWPAVLAVPCLYAQVFSAGVANMLFSAPFFVFAIPLFYQTMMRPTRRLIIVTTTVILFVFLAHAHLFLSLGPLTLLILIGVLAAKWSAAAAGGTTLRDRARDAARTVGVAVICVLPALLAFVRWYVRTFGAGRAEGAVVSVTQPLSEGFGAIFPPITEILARLPVYPLKTVHGFFDLWWWVATGLAAVVALSIGRLHRYRRAPVLELAFAVILAGYFLLPEHLTAHAGIASRHLSMAFWFLPVFFCPVPASVSRVGRAAVLGAIVALTVVQQGNWYRMMVRFQKKEVAGLEEVMEAAPPRKRLHFVKLDVHSDISSGSPFMHIEKFYMSDKLGSTADTTGISSTGAIRYKAGVNPHRITYRGRDFGKDRELWDNFDLVLVRRWNPTRAERALTEANATLLRASGDWELWQTKPRPR